MATTSPAVLNGHSESENVPLSAAQKLQQKHDSHKATIEEVADEEDLKPHRPEPVSSSVLEAPGDESAPGWLPPVSLKAAGKRKEETSSKPSLDISEEAFPALGGLPKTKQPATINSNWKNSNKMANGTNGTSSNGIPSGTTGSSTPTTRISTPLGGGDPRNLTIPGQVKEDYFLAKEYMLPRQALKKPLPDILKDFNKKSRKVTVNHSAGANGTTFSAAGPSREACQQALKDILAQVGAKVTSKASIPQSARAHIIGKGGSKIKEIQERSGAKIQIPKLEDAPHPTEEDDDPVIDIIVEGNAQSVAEAKILISRIAAERTSTVNTKLRTIPGEFYPFIEQSQKENGDVNIRVPQYYTYRGQQPSNDEGDSIFSPATDDHISLAGERSAVQEKKAEIESLAEQLHKSLRVEHLPIGRNKHQYIIGKRGISPEEFFKETGCAIMLPTDLDNENIKIVGRPDQTEAATQRAFDLVRTMQQDNFNAANQFRGTKDPRVHVDNLAQYLRQRKIIDSVERLHNSQVNMDEAAAWEVLSRDLPSIMNTKKLISEIIQAHPQSRLSTLNVDPFYYPHLQKDTTAKVKRDFGVFIVTPNSADVDAPVVLVFEGTGALEPSYEAPRGQPSPDQVKAFKQGLEEARNHIIDLLAAQGTITSTAIEVPYIFHDKLRRFITSEQKLRADDQFPVRVKPTGTLITLSGPESAVETLAQKVNAFVEQAIQDEKERGFTLSFDFPQTHANQLIGKQGSNIRELRDRFDVEIKVDNGKVELKGPKAKAEAAKTHINNLGKQWADEVTYSLKIDPKFHRELIGSGGATTNKLQAKYKVQIYFPRAAKPAKDDQSNVDAVSEAGRKGSRREQAPDEVIIRGPKKGADEARGEILDVVQYLADNSHTATISVQQSQIPSLIGQRGKAMDELRADTKTRIDIPNGKDAKDPSDIVEIQIRGTKSGVLQAKKILEEKKKTFDNTVSKTLEVDKKHHSALIGAQGSNIRNMVLQAGGVDDRREIARAIQFPKAESDGNLVKIEGNKDVVDKIIAAMQRIIAERDSQVTETIEVPTEKHRSLIGRGGETKKDLESKLKVSLDIPRQGNGQTGVKITGAPTEVEKAKSHILELIKEQEGETVQVPKNLHHIISDNGRFFRKLQSDLQVTVDHAGHKQPPKPSAPSSTRANGGSLPLITDDEDTVADAHSWNIITAGSGIDGEIPWVLRGPADNVTKAKSNLAAAIEQALKNTTTGYLVLPDPRTYRFVIGQGGSKVNSIRKETGCKITVPRDQAKDEAIEISGSAEGVEKAKDLVLQAVKEGSSGANGGRA